MTSPRSLLDGLARLYPASDGPLHGSALLWAHGGGFVHGDLDMPEADAVARAFADRGATVVSVDYALVGDDGSRTFPAGSDDILTAWAWLVEHAPELGAERLFVGGTSAGGNLIAGAILRLLGHAPASTLPLPTGVFLAYPTLLAVQPAPDDELRAALDANPDADVFTPPAVLAMYETYLGGDVTDAPLAAVPGRATPVDVAGFPPTIMVNGHVDELRMSGELFARTLADAGVDIDVSFEPGTAHGHLNRPEEPGFGKTIERVAGWMAWR